MQFLKKLRKWLIIILCVAFVVWLFGANWSFLFKKKVVGEVVAVEKVNPSAVAVLTGEAAADKLNPQVFSFSVGIKNKNSGEIFMASSEDRQWAAVEKGNCVVAVYFPYPPWEVLKANTSHNARLLRNYTNCEAMPQEDGFLETLKFFFLIP
ncbi:MAG: hypothetical protein ACXVAX_10495 [Pseudobdellovibrio sp.]